MKRAVALLMVLLSVSPVAAQEGASKDQDQERRIPATLAEAHVELERIFSTEELAKIDAMPSEHDMGRYHFGLGMGIRNDWGLWRGGPLAKHMAELGFTHPDIMSGVILETFWCKRHRQGFRLEERAASATRSSEIDRKLREEQAIRARTSEAAMRSMMMGLRFEKRDVPEVRIPTGKGPAVRSMSPFRDGVFLAVFHRWPLREGPVHADGYYTDPASGKTRRRPDMDDCVWRGLYLGADLQSRKMQPGDSFYTHGFYLDPKDHDIHRIRLAEVQEVYATVVAGGRAWFAGLTNGRPVLVGMGDRDRISISLPRTDEIPDLGFDGESLLAVYSRTIYRLTDRQWKLVYSGDILLPRSGLPPQRHGNTVFLRAEGIEPDEQRLWWLTMGEMPRLHLFAHELTFFEPNAAYFSLLASEMGFSKSDDQRSARMVDGTELFGPDIGRFCAASDEADSDDSTARNNRLMQFAHAVAPPGWGEASSYCVTSTGDLWACTAEGTFLLRRSKGGDHSIAIAKGSVRFPKDPHGSEATGQRVSVSGVTALPDDTLLLVGYTGLYRLKGDELIQELAFAPCDYDGKAAARHMWAPSHVLALDDGSYVIGSDSERGVYRLRRNDDGQWIAVSADEGDPVVW